MGLDADDLDDINRRSVEIVAEHAADCDLVVSGCLGPRGDGYIADTAMTPDGAAAYHRPRIDSLRDAGADLVSALTINNINEGVGIALAARESDVPCVVAFTTETDGRLPSGEKLADAIGAVDEATDSYPAYYMINCAHPTHFDGVLEPAPWMDRIRAIRANSSTMSHEELDKAEELDAGDPIDLARRCARLRERFPNLTIFGGCCGTNTSHIAEAASALSG
jgi:S-methylmethionine-dependent homocysteine/selenocysteine methylase